MSDDEVKAVMRAARLAFVRHERKHGRTPFLSMEEYLKDKYVQVYARAAIRALDRVRAAKKRKSS